MTTCEVLATVKTREDRIAELEHALQDSEITICGALTTAHNAFAAREKAEKARDEAIRQRDNAIKRAENAEDNVSKWRDSFRTSFKARLQLQKELGVERSQRIAAEKERDEAIRQRDKVIEGWIYSGTLTPECATDMCDTFNGNCKACITAWAEEGTL